MSEKPAHEAPRQMSASTLTLIMILAWTMAPATIVGANNIGNDVWNGQYYPPANSSQMDAILDWQNHSVYGRPLWANTTTGDVYYSPAPNHLGLSVLHPNGTTEVLNASLTGYTPGTNYIYNGITCNDGSMLISIKDSVDCLWSGDGGRTWAVIVQADYPQFWNFAIRGDRVYVGEYGGAIGDCADLWMSTDNGRAGTWSVVWQTGKSVSYVNHWHSLETDPHTDYVYAAFGDDRNGLARSTDGVAFQYWGAFNRYTAFAFTEHNVYLGDDTWSRIVVYNKTTGEWSSQILQGAHMLGPIYNIETGEHGVLYARTMTEGIEDRVAGLYVSADGVHWQFVLNMTGTPVPATGDSGWFDIHVFSDGHGRIIFGYANPTTNVADRGKVWVWSLKDLTQDEAYALDGTNSSPLTVDSTTWQSLNDAFDGQTGFVDLTGMSIKDPYVNVTGTYDENLIYNGTIPSEDDVNATWGAGAGWAILAEAGESDNISMGVSAMAHSAPYSLVIHGYNSSVAHGRVRYTRDFTLEPEKQLVGGQDAVVSFYANIKIDDCEPNGTNRWGSYVHAYLVTVFTDATSDARYLMGTGAAYEGQNYASYRGNYSANDWQRCYNAYEVPLIKTVRYIMLDFVIVGQIDVYVDDVQLTNGTALTPAMSGSGYASGSSSAVTLTIGGEECDFGSVAAGATESMHLTGVTLTGRVPFSASIAGSKHVTWSIWGEKVAQTSDGTMSDVSGQLTAGSLWRNASVTVWNSALIDVPSFLGRASQSIDPRLEITPDGGSVNITPVVWSYDEMTFFGNASRQTEYTITLTNLDDGDTYWLFHGGGGVSTAKADANGTLTFTFDGTGLADEITLERTTLFESLFSVFGLVIILAVFGAIISMVAIFRRG